MVAVSNCSRQAFGRTAAVLSSLVPLLVSILAFGCAGGDQSIDPSQVDLESIALGESDLPSGFQPTVNRAVAEAEVEPPPSPSTGWVRSWRVSFMFEPIDDNSLGDVVHQIDLYDSELKASENLSIPDLEKTASKFQPSQDEEAIGYVFLSEDVEGAPPILVVIRVQRGPFVSSIAVSANQGFPKEAATKLAEELSEKAAQQLP